MLTFVDGCMAERWNELISLAWLHIGGKVDAIVTLVVPCNIGVGVVLYRGPNVKPFDICRLVYGYNRPGGPSYKNESCLIFPSHGTRDIYSNATKQ